MKTKILSLFIILFALAVSAAPFQIFSPDNPPFNAANGMICGVSYNAYSIYYKSVAAGWGWKFDLSTNVHTASVGGNYIIEFSGKQFHNGCDIGSVTVVGNSTEKFRFAVYNPTVNGMWPISSLPITLTGFLP